MGCDIHLIVQVRGSEPNAPWRIIPIYRTCEWCDGTGLDKDPRDPAKPECYWCSENPGKEEGFSTRNYSAFAILADVRNGSRGDSFNPISEPKGLPDDLGLKLDDHHIKNEDGTNGKWLGDHSYSWLTLEELLEYDWTQKIYQSGVISMQGYVRWKAAGGGFPESFSQGIGGGGVEMVSNNGMELLITALSEEELEQMKVGEAPMFGRGKYYTKVAWGTDYAECASGFYASFLPALQEQTKDYLPDNVRIVFGFDS